MKKILIVDDEQPIRFILSKVIAKAGFEVETAEDGKTAFQKITSFRPHLVLLDIKLPDADGMEMLPIIRENSDIAVVMMTAYSDTKTAVEAIKLGAYDYLNKPFDNEEVVLVIQKALEKMELISTVEKLQKQLKTKHILGDSEAIKRVLQQINIVASSPFSVVLQGKSGTGKELFANMIHDRSECRKSPFIPVDCGAIPDSLFESELFGHKKGAFTGAEFDRKGIFEQANGGTLFLDEINNLSLNMQAKFLRVLQDKKIKPIGAEKCSEVNVRIIAASNVDLAEKVKKGEFRDDLYHRLNEFKIELPTLLQRKDDLPVLIKYFICESNNTLKKQVETVSKSAMRKLLDYPYSGNVRELKNLIKRAVLLAENHMIHSRHLAFEYLDYPNNNLVTLKEITKNAEINAIQKALNACNFDKSKTAELLGIPRSTLYRLREKYNLA